jgi:hypothetical protein
MSLSDLQRLTGRRSKAKSLLQRARAERLIE